MVKLLPDIVEKYTHKFNDVQQVMLQWAQTICNKNNPDNGANCRARPTAHVRRYQKFKVCKSFFTHSVTISITLMKISTVHWTQRRKMCAFWQYQNFTNLFLCCAQSCVNDHQPSEMSSMILISRYAWLSTR